MSVFGLQLLALSSIPRTSSLKRGTELDPMIQHHEISAENNDRELSTDSYDDYADIEPR